MIRLGTIKQRCKVKDKAASLSLGALSLRLGT
jgi:hypothetical protein